MGIFIDNSFEFFQKWSSLANQHESHDTCIVILTTINKQSQSSAQAVLLKEIKSEDFVFYENLCNQKDRNIEHNLMDLKIAMSLNNGS